MATKKWAVSKSSEKIALTYGGNVSKGIARMEETIMRQSKEISKMGACLDEKVKEP